MMTLTELEQAVLTKLLEGDHPVLTQLRLQLDHCRVEKRDLTGVGFFTSLAVSDDAYRIGDKKLQFGDVVAEIDGLKHGAGFELYVECGQLSMLEGYIYDEPWPDTLGGFTLRYLGKEARDWEALENALI